MSEIISIGVEVEGIFDIKNMKEDYKNYADSNNGADYNYFSKYLEEYYKEISSDKNFIVDGVGRDGSITPYHSNYYASQSFMQSRTLADIGNAILNHNIDTFEVRVHANVKDAETTDEKLEYVREALNFAYSDYSYGNVSCGLHVHIKFSPKYETLVVSKDFEEKFIKAYIDKAKARPLFEKGIIQQAFKDRIIAKSNDLLEYIENAKEIEDLFKDYYKLERLDLITKFDYFWDKFLVKVLESDLTDTEKEWYTKNLKYIIRLFSTYTIPKTNITGDINLSESNAYYFNKDDESVNPVINSEISRYAAINLYSLSLKHKTIEFRILPFAENKEEAYEEVKWLFETIESICKELEGKNNHFTSS